MPSRVNAKPIDDGQRRVGHHVVLPGISAWKSGAGSLTSTTTASIGITVIRELQLDDHECKLARPRTSAMTSL